MSASDREVSEILAGIHRLERGQEVLAARIEAVDAKFDHHLEQDELLHRDSEHRVTDLEATIQKAKEAADTKILQARVLADTKIENAISLADKKTIVSAIVAIVIAVLGSLGIGQVPHG